MSTSVSQISGLPFESLRTTLSTSPTSLALQPYANTRYVMLHNPDSTESIYIQCAPNQENYATMTLEITGGATGAVPLDTETMVMGLGETLTAAAGAYSSGADTYSVDARATGTLTVDAIPTAGQTFQLVTKKGPPATTITLTAIAGARAPGSSDFTIGGSVNATATNIATAVNDSPMSNSGAVCTAAAVGAVVTFTAGFEQERRGAYGNTASLSSSTDYGLQLTTTTTGVFTMTDFTGGVNADGGRTQPDGSVLYNSDYDYAANIARAINDPANSFAGAAEPVRALGNAPTDSEIKILSVDAGTTGNGYTVTVAGTTGITQNLPVLGGGTDVPATLTSLYSLLLGPGERFQIYLGPEGERNPLGTAGRWGSDPGAGIGLIAQAVANTPDLIVTYIQGPGSHTS